MQREKEKSILGRGIESQKIQITLVRRKHIFEILKMRIVGVESMIQEQDMADGEDSAEISRNI